MKTYIKFIVFSYIRSFCYVFFITLSLVVILNILSEIEFFKDYNVSAYLPHYLALLNSLDLIFEMFPFIFLISTQVFFVNLFFNNQINIFKYSGMKNSTLITLLSFLSFLMGILIITLFYGLSSNLKNIYLNYKNQFSGSKHLAVVTNNGLWIKDIVGQKRLIINANEITPNFLKNVTISEFDKNFDLSKIIISENINISSNDWKLYKSQLIENDIKKEIKEMVIYSNFNYETISNLFSNLSSLSIFELFKLKRNYKQINYSTIEVDAQLQKLYSYPFYFTLMTILSAIIMFNSRSFKSTTLKIILGLFFCVVIYYINNLSQALGTTGKIPLLVSVWITISIITVINFIAFQKINEK